MSLPIEIAGLDTLLPDIDDGTIVIVEGGADVAKNFFVRRLCRTAFHAGRPITFITSRDGSEVQALFTRENGEATRTGASINVLERDAVDSLSAFIPKGGVLAVDSFSFLTLGLAPTDLALMLRELHRTTRETGAIVLLATDQGMLDPRGEAVVTHLAEGHIEFHAQEGTEGLLRFIRIPKWADGRFIDRNIYYEFDGKRIAIDLRARVL